jgi:hypothetical protein
MFSRLADVETIGRRRKEYVNVKHKQQHEKAPAIAEAFCSADGEALLAIASNTSRPVGIRKARLCPPPKPVGIFQ